MSINAAKWLDILLDLRRKPVGIKFLLTEADYTQSLAKVPQNGMPYCTAVKWAGQGRSYKMDAAHCSCFAASRALGMADITEDALSGSRHAKLGVYENLGVSRAVARDMVYCAHKCAGVEIMPLEQYTTSNPDVVILVTTPYNAMRITQAYAYHHGQLKNIKMAGMCAICQECTSYPHERNMPNISMLCSGTRCVAQWSKDELGIGIPYHYLEPVINGLRRTVNPMEFNQDKERIAQRLAEAGQADTMEIVLSQNYYTGAYGTPEQVARRNRKT
ncbi:DUF169 domain-containing protein [Sporomusa sp. GT1]|uniref:DUF169 domain-containing protein n=1 Tax=Sporomusa sp. GT1 TaxID=1534747 RepID=UPI001666E345|nr:DUF169 domain-containing protein [Sporomusa sp. GT1]